jgi:hypothetical protein
LDTEFGLGAKILDELKDEEFARKLGADPLRPSKDQHMRDYTPQLYVCQKPPEIRNYRQFRKAWFKGRVRCIP